MSEPSPGARALCFLALAVATLAVFQPVVGFDFVSYDDWQHVRDNPAIRAGLSADSVAHAFAGTPYLFNWIPLTFLSYLADFELWGLDPSGFHATNLLLHTAGVLLLLAALHRLSGAFWPSLFAAAVFALHPLQVEPVAWVSSRKDVLAGVFFAATLLGYAVYARRGGALWYAVVCLGTAAGLLAKPIVVTLPFVLLLLDFWPLKRLGRRALLEKLPLLALAGAALAVAFAVQPVVTVGGHSFGVRLANAVDSTFAYLRASFWPTGLAAFYPHPRGALPLGRVAAEGALLLVVSALALREARRRPHLLVGWLWFLGVLFPVLGFVEIGLQARADRYMYLPIVGLALVVAWSGAELAARSRAARGAVLAAALLATVGMAATARAQLAHWRDSFALYARAVAVTEGNYLAHYGLAGVLAEAGRLDEALAQLARASAADPLWPLPYERMAEIHAVRGEHEQAIELYRKLIAGRADNAGWHAALARSALALGDGDTALGHYRLARERGDVRPQTADALAWLLATRPGASEGDAQEAERIAGEALAAHPPHLASLLDTLAAARAAAGRTGEAAQIAERARARAAAGAPRAAAGRAGEAAQIAERARVRAVAEGDAALAVAIAQRAALYRAGRAFVQDGAVAPKASGG